MGNCDSSMADSNKKNRKINAELIVMKKQEENVIKLLLLGAGESGKSTILKQMKIIHDNGFSQDESTDKIKVICANAIQGMDALLKGMRSMNIDFASHNCVAHETLIKGILHKNEEFQVFTNETYVALRTLWDDKGVRAAFDSRENFYLHDSAQYFFDALDRIVEPNYVPSEQDILHTRIPTMGVIEVKFVMKSKVWRVFDVGGQRSQRKKWIHCFDDAKALIYVASLSEFDQVLLEDNATNRMQESLQLFKQVINNRYFMNTSVILFLNKKDLFKQKIMNKRSIRKAFPNFQGPDEDYDAAVEYIEKQYNQVNMNPEKNIYVHHTCATDTEQVQFVLDSVLDTILSSKLKGCGLY